MEKQNYTESTPESLTKIVEGWSEKHSPSFDDLSAFVLQTHQTAQASAIRAINQMATLRNWLIGCYIVEYEQGGSDRAKYGDRLLKRLEEKVNTKGLNETLFLASRRFYIYYPQISEFFRLHRISATASPKLDKENQISATLSPIFNGNEISATPSHQFTTSPLNYPQPKIIHSKVNNMKNFLSFSLLIVLTMFISSCSNVKSDGIYKTDNGWDIVEEGKTYSYSCEPDGLYLYLDWEGKNEYSLSFSYNSEIYRKTVGHTDRISFTSLKFLCKNKDGKYVYVAGWNEFDGCFYALKEIQFQIDAPNQPIYPYSRMKEYFSLMEKYTSN